MSAPLAARAHAGMPDGWRDVPMPRQVAALPRTRGGIPITYTVAWSSETEPKVRKDPALRAIQGDQLPALFHGGRQGKGSPKLAVSDVARVRRAIVLGLCQACGHPLAEKGTPPWRHGRWLCDLRNQGQEIKIGLRRVPLVVDGWSCPSCLAYALKVCPGLVRKDWTPGAGDALRLLHVRHCEYIATWEDVPALGPDRGPVVGWIKVAPTSFDVVDPATFLTTTEATA
jgi:hypothetical protein